MFDPNEAVDSVNTAATAEVGMDGLTDDIGMEMAGAVGVADWDHKVLHSDWGDTRTPDRDGGFETVAVDVLEHRGTREWWRSPMPEKRDRKWTRFDRSVRCLLVVNHMTATWFELNNEGDGGHGHRYAASTQNGLVPVARPSRSRLRDATWLPSSQAGHRR